MSNNLLQLRSQMPLRSNEFESIGSFFLDCIFDSIVNAILVFLCFRSFNLFLHVENFLGFCGTVFLNDQQLLLGDSQLVFQDAIYDL